MAFQKLFEDLSAKIKREVLIFDLFQTAALVSKLLRLNQISQFQYVKKLHDY